MATNLALSNEKMYEQGNIDTDAGKLMDGGGIFTYEIEKAYLTIHDLVRDSGFGDLVDDVENE